MRLVSLAPLLIALPAIGLAAPAWAVQEFYVGEPVVREGMQIVPNYLTGVEMDKIPSGMGMTRDSVHLEADIHATKEEGLSSGHSKSRTSSR